MTAITSNEDPTKPADIQQNIKITMLQAGGEILLPTIVSTSLFFYDLCSSYILTGIYDFLVGIAGSYGAYRLLESHVDHKKKDWTIASAFTRLSIVGAGCLALGAATNEFTIRVDNRENARMAAIEAKDAAREQAITICAKDGKIAYPESPNRYQDQYNPICLSKDGRWRKLVP